MQEKTYREVEEEFGLPRSSVARHLEQARGLLAKRLARRGITVSSVLLAILLEDAAKGSGVPAVLLVRTVEAARTFTEQTTGIVSENVARLVKGGLAKMAKGWTQLSAVLAGWVGLLGAGLIACQTLKAWPEQSPESAPPATATVNRPAQEGDKQARTDLYGDPLPAGALARMGTTRLRHTDQVWHVLFAPDGKTVASMGTDDSVRLWDTATGKLVRNLRLGWNLGVSFAGDGKTLASLTKNQLGLWDIRTGEQLGQIELKLEPDQQMFSLAISFDGKMAASFEGKSKRGAGGKVDGVIRLWDVASGNPLRVLRGHGKSIRSLSFSPDNKTLAAVAGGDDKKVVRLWDVSSGRLLHQLEHPLMVRTVSFSPDGKTLASGGSDKAIPILPNPEKSPSAVWLWDVTTGKLLRTLQGHQQFIASLSFSPDGKVLASGSWDKTIRLWDVTAGKQLRKMKCLAVSFSLSFAPDGKMLASGGTGPAMHLWDVTTGQELYLPQGVHTGKVHSISFSPDGRILATAASWGEGDDTVRLWESVSGKPLRRLKHPEGAHSVVIAPDGKALASGGGGTVCLWDATTGKQWHKLEAPGGSPLAFSPDCKMLAAGSNDGSDRVANGGTLRLWDVATGAQLRTLEHLHKTLSVAFSPDGKTLAVGTGRGTLHLWNAVTGKKLLKLEKVGAAVLSFSPDGKTLAAGSDNKIRLLEVSTGKELHRLTGHSGHVESVAFSPSGRWLASGGSDQTVRLWEVNAGLASECHQFRGHAAEVTAVAFSPDGRRLSSGSWDSTALVWDVTGRAGEQARAARVAQGELTACWQSLLSTDAAPAYLAVRTLAAVPDQTMPFLAERLFQKRPDFQQVAHLLADLDSEEFRVRSQAAKELEKWGEAVEPALRQALKDKPSVEVRRRILQLLETLDPPHPEGVSPRLLRWARALEVLEWIGTPAAQELLGKVAEAPPREEVGQAAQAALKRLHALSNP